MKHNYFNFLRPINLILLFIFVVCLIGFPGLAEKEQLKSSQKVSGLLMEAKAALEDELYQLAQQKIEIALRTMDGMPQEKRESTILLAKALYGQKQYRDMINLLSASRKQASGTAQADAFDFWLAMAYFESAQIAQVLDCIQDFDKNYPASPYLPHVIRLRAKSYEQQGKHEEAIKSYDEALKLLPDHQFILKNKAIALEAMQKEKSL